MNQYAPTILRLPVGLLHSIFSLIVPLIKHDELYKLRHLLLKESPFHTLRSTCRIFRWIVDDLPFWRKDTFRLPFTLNPEYLEVLLSDPHLQQCLAQKTGWRVRSLNIAQILGRHIPQFGQGVHYLQLDNKYTSKAWHSIPETIFGVFPVLTVLELSSDTHVHLDILPSTLRRLKLDAPVDNRCHCFNTFRNLEQLTFHHRSPEPLHFKKLLPFNSKDTLREFQCAIHPVFYLLPKYGPSIPDFALLHQFENLTTLRTKGRWLPLNLMVYQHLQQSPFRLKIFETEAPEPDCDPDLVPALTALVNSPVLHDLQRLQIKFGGYARIDVEKQHVYEPFIKAIANLPSLEELVLLQFLLHKTWLTHFGNSQCLKYVNWNYSSFRPLEPFGNYDVRDSERGLVKILSQFPCKTPEVEISCWDYQRKD